MAELEARRADIHYDEIECKSALNPVKGMGFSWSLNPYVGCEHRCSFCYVRAYELRADRPHDDRYGRTIRVKTNVAQVLRCELAKRSWKKETVVIGAATDPYQPAEGRFKLTRQCLEALRDFSNPAGIITRGPMIVRDIDVLTELAKRADLGVTFSIPTIDMDVWRKTEPGTAPPQQRRRASAWRRSCPVSPTGPSRSRRWSKPRAPRGPPAYGAACCTCARAPASTS